MRPYFLTPAHRHNFNIFHIACLPWWRLLVLRATQSAQVHFRPADGGRLQGGLAAVSFPQLKHRIHTHQGVGLYLTMSNMLVVLYRTAQCCCVSAMPTVQLTRLFSLTHPQVRGGDLAAPHDRVGVQGRDRPLRHLKVSVETGGYSQPLHHLLRAASLSNVIPKTFAARCTFRLRFAPFLRNVGIVRV